jgi:hypothetical protein
MSWSEWAERNRFRSDGRPPQSPLALVACAQQLAASWLQLPAAQARQEFLQLQQDQPVLHALVKSLLLS